MTLAIETERLTNLIKEVVYSEAEVTSGFTQHNTVIEDPIKLDLTLFN